jgi:hypothetical protein
MKLKADEQGRVACLELFPPNALFSAEREPDGSIRMKQIGEGDVPTVRPIRTADGDLMLPTVLDNKAIAAAVRAQREPK